MPHAGFAMLRAVSRACVERGGARGPVVRIDEIKVAPSQEVGWLPAENPRPGRVGGQDDALLVDLKETKDLSWKQIADFFPGRSSGTLQVRYCTKLKAKEIFWTEALVSP